MGGGSHVKRIEDADWAIVLAKSFCSSKLQRARHSGSCESWGHYKDGGDCKDKTGYNYDLITVAYTKSIHYTCYQMIYLMMIHLKVKMRK